jgi:hypothetical protein
MKYQIFLFLILFFYLAGCSSKRETVRDDDETTVELKDKAETPADAEYLPLEFREREYIKSSRIRSVDKIGFDYDAYKQLVNRNLLSTIKYDKTGLPTETILHSSGNKFLYKYDEAGFRTEARRLNAEGKPENIFTYEYDDRGNKTKSVRYDMKGNIEEYYVYKNDSRGNLIEDLRYDKDGNLYFKLVNEYDDAGNKIKTFHYDGGENLKYINEFKYDSKNNVIEEVEYDSRGQALGIIQYVYKYY